MSCFALQCRPQTLQGYCGELRVELAHRGCFSLCSPGSTSKSSAGGSRCGRCSYPASRRRRSASGSSSRSPSPGKTRHTKKKKVETRCGALDKQERQSPRREPRELQLRMYNVYKQRDPSTRMFRISSKHKAEKSRDLLRCNPTKQGPFLWVYLRLNTKKKEKSCTSKNLQKKKKTMLRKEAVEKNRSRETKTNTMSNNTALSYYSEENTMIIPNTVHM